MDTEDTSLTSCCWRPLAVTSASVLSEGVFSSISFSCLSSGEDSAFSSGELFTLISSTSDNFSVGESVNSGDGIDFS